MKRIVQLALVLTLMLSLALPCLGAELAVSDSKAAAGQTVYLTVSIDQPLSANAVAVKCEYDTALLTAQPDLCAWETVGTLSAFQDGNIGVWAVEKTQELKGRLCVLAFGVKEGTAFSQTTVKCTVVLKEGSREVANLTAEGVISCNCTHSYGSWSGSELGHSRTCSLCGGVNTQSHSWDAGKSAQKPGDNTVTVITYTCTVCKQTRSVEKTADSHDQQTPQPSGPSQPGGQVDEPIRPSQPTGPHYPDHSTPQQTEPGQTVIPGQDAGHDHEQGQQEHSHQDTLTIGATDEHDHDHSPSGEDPVILWVILGVLALAVTAGVLFVKKR